MSNSKRNTLVNSAYIGGASVVNVLLVGVVRIKFLALALGPQGIGIIGYLSSFIAILAQIFSLGLGQAITREVAFKSGLMRKNFFSEMVGTTFMLACAGAAVLIIVARTFNGVLEELGDDRWGLFACALALVFSMLASVQIAYITGLGDSKGLAKITIYSSVLALISSLASLLAEKNFIVGAYILAVPLSMLLLATKYNKERLTNFSFTDYDGSLEALIPQLRKLVGIGLPLMLAGTMVPIGQFVIRYVINDRMGMESVGIYQAASYISLAYLGFVLSAMGSEYLPRITKAYGESRDCSELINNQLEIVLVLATPAIIALYYYSDFIVSILYTEDFGASASVLKWFAFGDVLKLISWPLGVFIVALGQSRKILIIEFVCQSLMLIIVWYMLPKVGINASGIAYLLMYVIFFALVTMCVKRSYKYSFSNVVIVRSSAVVLGLILGYFMDAYDHKLSMYIGSVFFGFSLISTIRYVLKIFTVKKLAAFE